MLAVFISLPVLRDEKDSRNFFISGRDKAGDILLRRRIILDNLRDLQIEQELGKMNEQEFTKIALPLAEELKKIETEYKTVSGKSLALGAAASNRLGVFCPSCGFLSRKSGETFPSYCQQCGHEFK